MDGMEAGTLLCTEFQTDSMLEYGNQGNLRMAKKRMNMEMGLVNELSEKSDLRIPLLMHSRQAKHTPLTQQDC